MIDNPNKDIETLKESSYIIEFLVPEDLVRYMNFMKYR